MKLQWKMRENVYSQDLDMKQISQLKEVPADINPWLGSNLLDVEAFRQYKKLGSSYDNKETTYYSEVIKQYEKIDNIIEEALVDAALIQDMYEQNMHEQNMYTRGNVGFEREFADLVHQLAPYLHSHAHLPLDFITVPTSEREDINQLLNRIQSAILGDVENLYGQEENLHRFRNVSTAQKNIIRRSIVQIAEKYSEESRKRYNTFYVLCKKNNIRGIYSYDFARAAICPDTTLEYITNVETAIRTRTSRAFENRLNVEDFHNGLSTEKINLINKFFAEREAIRKGMPHYDEMSGKIRRYFGKGRRCVAIMEFPDNDSENMFSLSGIELNDDKTYNTYFEIRIANPIARELNLDGTYLFCKQNVLMRRYAHLENKVYSRLPQWNYLDNDADWKLNQMDYACCERKFIAKLEMDHQSQGLFPRNIELWTRLPICDNCNYAISDYENSYGAVIRRI